MAVSAGGGIVNDVGATGTVSHTLLLADLADGGTGGLGGNGGNGQGGGIWNGTPNPVGGAGAGGSAGQGVGGGLYVTPSGIACADLWTIILANHAATSDDDVFGTLGSY